MPRKNHTVTKAFWVFKRFENKRVRKLVVEKRRLIIKLCNVDNSTRIAAPIYIFNPTVIEVAEQYFYETKPVRYAVVEY